MKLGGVVALENQLIFSVNDGVHGRELWQITASLRGTPPSVSAGPDTSIVAGTNFASSSGWFSDPDTGDTWTATVNYDPAPSLGVRRIAIFLFEARPVVGPRRSKFLARILNLGHFADR